MSELSKEQFLDILRSGRLLEESKIADLQSTTGQTAESVEISARERGWLTKFQINAIHDKGIESLAVGSYRLVDLRKKLPYGRDFIAINPALSQKVSLLIIDPQSLTVTDNLEQYVARTQAACLVQHPHLVNLIDAGQIDGIPFVAQEMIDGVTLEEYVANHGKLAIDLASSFGSQIAIAMQAAHQKNIVHGRLSPRSVLYVASEKSIRVADLSTVPGLEIAIGGSSLQSKHPDELRYLPPEMIHHPESSPSCDLYGIGAILYFLLSGKPPYGAESCSELIKCISDTPPIPIDSLRFDLPVAITTLVTGLLDRDPLQRPPIESVIATLEPFCEGAIPPSKITYQPAAIAIETSTNPQPVTTPLASETSTKPGQADQQPTIELMPEIAPLEEGDGSGSSREIQFDASMAENRVRAAKKPVTRKNKLWLIVGFILHLTAILLVIGYLTDWFSLAKPSEKSDTSRFEQKTGENTSGKPKIKPKSKPKPPMDDD